MRILGVDITEKNNSEILDEFVKTKKGYVCVTSVHGLIEAWENVEINMAFDKSFANLPDGMPIVYWGRYFKKNNMKRITGPDFIYDFLNMINKNSFSLSTIGGSIESIEKLRTILKQNYPKIKYEHSNTDMIDINNYKDVSRVETFLKDNPTDYTFVFLSTPKQDLLMYKLNQKLDTSKFIGFGAALDYFVGNLHQPPKLLQSLSLEWLYRLIQEPSRLYKRYMNIIPKFFIYNLFNLFVRK